MRGKGYRGAWNERHLIYWIKYSRNVKFHGRKCRSFRDPVWYPTLSRPLAHVVPPPPPPPPFARASWIRRSAQKSNRNSCWSRYSRTCLHAISPVKESWRLYVGRRRRQRRVYPANISTVIRWMWFCRDCTKWRNSQICRTSGVLWRRPTFYPLTIDPTHSEGGQCCFCLPAVFFVYCRSSCVVISCVLFQ